MKKFALVIDGQLREIIPEFAVFERSDENGGVTQVSIPLAERYPAELIDRLIPYVVADWPEPGQISWQLPTVVTMRQARLALLQAGHYTSVEQAVAALSGDEGIAARIEWEFAATVERDSPIVALLSNAIGLTNQDLDQLFAAAVLL